MKNIRQYILLLFALSLLTACQSTYKPFAASVLTADKAFDSWCDYVVWQKRQAGYDAVKLASQETRVRAMYLNWQTANEAVYNAQKAYAAGNSNGKSALQSSLAAAAAASGNVIDLVLQFLPADRAAKLKGL